MCDNVRNCKNQRPLQFVKPSYTYGFWQRLSKCRPSRGTLWSAEYCGQRNYHKIPYNLTTDDWLTDLVIFFIQLITRSSYWLPLATLSIVKNEVLTCTIIPISRMELPFSAPLHCISINLPLGVTTHLLEFSRLKNFLKATLVCK